MVKINDKVLTPHGRGVVIGFDLSESERTKRAIVKLDMNLFDFDPCYFLKELEVLK